MPSIGTPSFASSWMAWPRSTRVPCLSLPGPAMPAASATATIRPRRRPRWAAPDVQLEIARGTLDANARKRAYSEFQTLFAVDLPAVLLFHPVYEYAIDSSVQGVSLPSSIHPSDRFATEAQWYVKTK